MSWLGAGVSPVPWNRPKGGFCCSDAKMAWLCCPRDCFGDASWATGSSLRRPGHSTAGRVLSGFRISSIPRIDHFRAGRADSWWLCVHPRCRAEASPAYAAISQFACAGNACRNHTGLRQTAVDKPVCLETHTGLSIHCKLHLTINELAVH